jgi:hypothetical protein
VKNLISKVKDPDFHNKLVVTFGSNILSYHLKTPTKDNKLSSVEHFPDTKKYPYFMMLPEVASYIYNVVEIIYSMQHSQWCKLVRPDSGYKVFIDTQTQNYAIKEDHIIVFDDVQSLTAKVRHYQMIFL